MNLAPADLRNEGLAYDLLDQPRYGNDFRDVQGQEHVKRALEVAAAGSHCVFMLWTTDHSTQLGGSPRRGHSQALAG